MVDGLLVCQAAKDLWLATDVSEKPVGPILKGLFERCRRPQLHCGGGLKNRINTLEKKVNF